jgi:hypothetical protein
MTWKRRPVAHFSRPSDARSWNGQFPRTPAFAIYIRGYLHGIINGQRYRAHRVAFALYHGREPVGEIDHIDGVGTNNAQVNLREVSSAENKRNLAISRRNSSGAIGVSYSSSKGLWRAYVGLDGRQKHIGYFENIEDAKAARKVAQENLGFHANHGRAA